MNAGTNASRRFALAIAAAAALSATGALAQAWPSKPIRFIVPNAPGGTTDLMGRVVAEPLKDRLPQPVIVENRAGAAGLLGLEQVYKSPPDGYTFVVAASSIATLPIMNKNATYNASRDFSPVAGIAIAPFLVMVRADFPAKNLQEFIAYVKANPGKVNVAATGNGSFDHLAGTKFALATGTNMTWIAYKGEVAAVPEIVAGRNDVSFLQWGLSGPHITAGRIRVLASMSAQRHPSLPSIPTTAEQGNPVEAAAWFAIFGPANVPQPILAQLNREINAILKSPETVQKIRGIYQEPMVLSPEQLGEVVRTTGEDWARVIKSAKLKVE
jgi:tripartite-type tricarboxylate transporter receptor subunit TctC